MDPVVEALISAESDQSPSLYRDELPTIALNLNEMKNTCQKLLRRELRLIPSIKRKLLEYRFQLSTAHFPNQQSKWQASKINGLITFLLKPNEIRHSLRNGDLNLFSTSSGSILNKNFTECNNVLPKTIGKPSISHQLEQSCCLNTQSTIDISPDLLTNIKWIEPSQPCAKKPKKSKRYQTRSQTAAQTLDLGSISTEIFMEIDNCPNAEENPQKLHLIDTGSFLIDGNDVLTPENIQKMPIIIHQNDVINTVVPMNNVICDNTRMKQCGQLKGCISEDLFATDPNNKNNTTNNNIGTVIINSDSVQQKTIDGNKMTECSKRNYKMYFENLDEEQITKDLAECVKLDLSGKIMKELEEISEENATVPPSTQDVCYKYLAEVMQEFNADEYNYYALNSN